MLAEFLIHRKLGGFRRPIGRNDHGFDRDYYVRFEVRGAHSLEFILNGLYVPLQDDKRLGRKQPVIECL